MIIFLVIILNSQNAQKLYFSILPFGGGNITSLNNQQESFLDSGEGCLDHHLVQRPYRRSLPRARPTWSVCL